MSILLLLFLVIPIHLYGEERLIEDLSAQNRMDRLEWMIGSWTGTGWIDRGREGRVSFTYNQDIKRKQNGSLVLIDGGSSLDSNGKHLYATLRVISSLADDEPFLWTDFAFQSAFQRSNDAYINGEQLQVGYGALREEEERVGAGEFRPSIMRGADSWVRITIRRDAEGQLIETAEMRESNEDDNQWFQFLEITMKESHE